MSEQAATPATAEASARPAGRPSATARLPAVAGAVVCVVLAIYLGLSARDASLVGEANEQGQAGRYEQALKTAERVRRPPADVRALLVRARASTLARQKSALQLWAELGLRDPNNWQVHWEWARALAYLDRPFDAVLSRYARARELNPRLPAIGSDQP